MSSPFIVLYFLWESNSCNIGHVLVPPFQIYLQSRLNIMKAEWGPSHISPVTGQHMFIFQVCVILKEGTKDESSVHGPEKPKELLKVQYL